MKIWDWDGVKQERNFAKYGFDFVVALKFLPSILQNGWILASITAEDRCGALGHDSGGDCCFV